MLHLILPHSNSRRPIRLLRSALPTAILALIVGGAAESVMAQTPPNYACYFRKPSGEVVNLSSICGDDEAEDEVTDGSSISIRDVQVTDAGLTGVIVNESDQPVQIGDLGYELLQTEGQAVLAGVATPATDVLLPNEPVQFIADFSGDDRTQLAEYANADLELAIAPDSVSPIALDDDLDDGTVSGERGDVQVIDDADGDEPGDFPVVGENEISEEELDDFPLVGEDDDGLDDLDNGLDDDFNNDLETDGLDGLDDDSGPDATDDNGAFDSGGDNDLGDIDTSDVFDDNDTLNDDNTLDTVGGDGTFDSTDDAGSFDSDDAF